MSISNTHFTGATMQSEQSYLENSFYYQTSHQANYAISNFQSARNRCWQWNIKNAVPSLIRFKTIL